MKHRTAWKTLVKKHGFEKIYDNPFRYLYYHKTFYSERHLKRIRKIILKHHTKNGTN